MTSWFVSYAVYAEDNFVEQRGTLILDFDSKLLPGQVLKKIEEDLCKEHGIDASSLHFDAFNRV